MLKNIETRTQEAVTLSIVNAGCLWWLTWLQFVTAMFYGLPVITFNPAHNLGYYVAPDGWPTNLPTLFLIVTVLAVLILFSAAPIFLAGSKAKIRQLVLILAFSLIALWFSLFIARSESEQYVAVKNLLEWYRGDDLPFWANDRRVWEIPRLELVIDAYLKSKH